MKKRRYWGVEDLGPAEPLPEMKPPPPKEESQKQSSESKYPHLEFIKASDLFAIPPREFYLGKQYQRGAVSGTMAPYAPKLIAQEPEAMESRVGETALKGAMERLIDVGTVRVFDGYKAGKPVHELEIAEGGSNAT